MCELFGVSSGGKVAVRGYLEEFFSHSVRHPNGWGIALFYGNSVSLEKEPVQASKSRYLRERLRSLPEQADMIAHIRFATRGADEYENSHPFVRRDNFNNVWTFAHNGTIFNYPPVDKYFGEQEGQTDSERVLYYVIDQINERQSRLNRPLDFEERFRLLDGIVCDMSAGNKLNLLLYDGGTLYVHCNYANTLYCLQKEGAAFFSTVPLSKEDWQPVPFTTLLAYREGKRVMTGTNHGNQYLDNENDAKMLFIDYSSL